MTETSSSLQTTNGPTQAGKFVEMHNDPKKLKEASRRVLSSKLLPTYDGKVSER